MPDIKPKGPVTVTYSAEEIANLVRHDLAENHGISADQSDIENEMPFDSISFTGHDVIRKSLHGNVR